MVEQLTEVKDESRKYNTWQTKIAIEITEGRKHIVRKLCHEARLRLIHLHRSRISEILLQSVDEKFGDFRLLTEKEVESLWSAAGGKEKIYFNQVTAIFRMWQLYEKAGITRVPLDNWMKKYQLYDLAMSILRNLNT